MVEVITTKMFTNTFSSLVFANKFVENFKNWKESKTDSPLFGKDAGYREPKLSSGYLMHVHTPPNKKEERYKWDEKHKHGYEKTSNSALVYVKRGDSYLLIDWIKENAHEETDYSPIAKAKLKKFAEIAEKFLSRETLAERFTQLTAKNNLLQSILKKSARL